MVVLKNSLFSLGNRFKFYGEMENKRLGGRGRGYFQGKTFEDKMTRIIVLVHGKTKKPYTVTDRTDFEPANVSSSSPFGG